MKRVIAVLSCFVLAIVLVKFVPAPSFLQEPYKGEVVEIFETQKTPFRIRINKHIERGGFMPALNGAYYVFHSESGSCSDQWRELMTVRHDDPVDIPRDHVRFSGEKVAYFFMSTKYAVTTDGGAGWSIVNINDYLPRNEKCGSIEDLRFEESGAGQIRLHCYAVSPKILQTNDFGRSWREKKGAF